ncbi:MAG: transglycosylase SLT domain-containing protein [Deltaproteobacteria bacterium]|nr:transglycosylase SLT domain-containing protein [Deltaproteobacteria bacterium]
MKNIIILLILFFQFIHHPSVFADDLNPANTHILNPWYIFFNGYQAYQSNNWETSLSFLEQATDKYILYDYAIYYRASALSNLNRYDEALLYFNKIIKEYPDSPLFPSTILSIGDIFLNTGSYEKAKEYFNMFISRLPSHNEVSQALYKYSISLENTGRHEESQNILKRLYIEYPMDKYTKMIPEPILSADELYNRIQNLFNAREYKAVIKESLFTKQERFLMMSAKSLYYTKAYNEAMEFFKTLLDNTNNNNIKEEIFSWLGKTYSNLNQSEDAVKVYKEYMDTFPDGIYTDELIYRTSIISRESGAEAYALELLNKLANKYPLSKWKDDALWQMAWMHYEKKDYRNTEKYLAHLIASPSDKFRKQALYWYGKVLLKLGSKDKAIDVLKRLYLSETLPSYYGVLAKKILEDMGIKSKDAAINPLSVIGDTQINTTAAEGLDIKRARELISMNLTDLAYLELESVKKKTDLNDFIQTGILFRSIGKLNRCRIIGLYLLKNPSMASENHLFQTVLPHADPVGYKTIVDKITASSLIDPYLVYAVITQESGFNETVISRAGAIGLMQIMPKTGLKIAETLSMDKFQVDDLFLADVNVTMGTTYLKEVTREFNGNIYHALAAYNAGPHMVKAWLKKYNNIDTDEFVENIPYRETRNYVKQVMAAYEIYRYVYNPKSDLGFWGTEGP